jgi:4a-hydroxytetrahydrobiopterin dehydratase
MVDTLAAKTCTPCKGGIPPLTPQEAEHFHVHVPQREVRDEARRIERTFRLRNFAEAFALVQQVGVLAEAEGHHPDISFGWGYVTVVMQTKKIKGLHENDFIMAAKIDRLSEPVILPSIGP